MQSALLESDRALAFGEEARDLAALAGTRAFQAQLARQPRRAPGAGAPPRRRRPARARPPLPTVLPVEGRLVTGMGEISDAGVHARGLTFAAAAGAPAVAPRAGRIAYAGALPRLWRDRHHRPWRRLDDHDHQSRRRSPSSAATWSAPGSRSAAPARRPQVTVELRRTDARSRSRR